MTEKETQIRDYLLSRVKGTMKEPHGKLRHPYLVPGDAYGKEQWDWDSCFEAQALFTAFELFGEEQMEAFGLTREAVAAHAKGCILNFLEDQEEDGYLPILVEDGGLFEGYFKAEHEKGQPMNPAKLFCTFLCGTCRFTGDYDWFPAEQVIAYLRYFEENLYDEATGLFFFQDDIMVGIDNNPTVFFRNPRSAADIFLNCVMYREYLAAAEILGELGRRKGEESAVRAEQKKGTEGGCCQARQEAEEVSGQEKWRHAAEEYARWAERLKEAVNREMWDEHDGLYYSQDLTRYRTPKRVKDVAFHSGLTPSWNCTPLKIRFWGCFLPMWAGICSAEQAERMCRHLRENEDILAAYGIRTCARTEKMYSLEKSSNPSNWLGAVWVLANVLVWKGLKDYGQVELAERVRQATIELLAKNLREHGELFESYHPDTGEPMLHPGFLSHNMPVMEMLRDGKL